MQFNHFFDLLATDLHGFTLHKHDLRYMTSFKNFEIVE